MTATRTRRVALASWGCASIFLSVGASVAMAAEKQFAAPQSVAHAPTSATGSLAQVTLSLLLVLAAVFVAAWVVRRMRGFSKFGTSAIQIIADAPLGTKERAVLIQVGQQQLLLGVAPGQVNMLHVLAEPVGTSGMHTQPDSPAQTGAGTAGRLPGGADFKAILKRSLGL